MKIKRISVPDILANCPTKLLKYYPLMCNSIKSRKDALKVKDLKVSCLPKLVILVIEGSRYGGKSHFAVRGGTGAILDGYAESMMFCTITEDGSKNSMPLVDKVLAEAEEPITKQRDSERPMRVLSHGEVIYIDSLNKQDSKARQQEADILILDEIEKWNESDGNNSFLTMIRHFHFIIILSNHLPRWAKTICDSFGAIYERIDYWENPSIEQSIKDGLERRRQIDPDGWAREVMYMNTSGENRVYTEKQINNLFTPSNKFFTPYISIISVDVGAGGPDESSVLAIDMDKNGVMQARILTDECIASDILVQRVARYRVDNRADEEIWDAQGVGLGIMQFRCPREQWQRHGIVPFGGKAIDTAKYYNARAEAFMLVADALQRGCLTIKGATIRQQEDIINELRAITFRDIEQARTNAGNLIRIEKKEIIKKALGGKSPNKLDALTMGVWRLLTFHKHRAIMGDRQSDYTIRGVPTLE